MVLENNEIEFWDKCFMIFGEQSDDVDTAARSADECVIARRLRLPTSRPIDPPDGCECRNWHCDECGWQHR